MMQKNLKLTRIITLFIILAIVVFINLIFNKLNFNFDLTENEMYKISDETKEITSKLDKKMNVYCFVEDENKANVISELTANFCKTSDMLNYNVMNPIEHPEVTKRYTEDGSEITNNTVIFDNGENYKIIPYEEMFSYNYLTGQNNLLVAEEKFCTAVMSLNQDNVAKVALLTGHGESFDDSLKNRVENIGAKCESVDIRNNDISGFNVLMLISPKIDFTGSELEKIDSFLSNGGTVIASIDASIPHHEMLEGFLAEWGIVVDRNMVFSTDAKSIMGNQPYSVIGSLNSHPITDALIKDNISPVFFASRGITPKWEVQNGISVTVLAQSSENASAISIDTQEEEENGVYALLTLSQGEKGRIFTFGSNMFFSEDLKVYNQDLLRNIITWSTDGELISGVSPKIVTGSNISVPKSSIMLWIVLFGVLVPALIAVAGIVVAIRRKKL